MTIISEFAPAKINMTLSVLGRRADGYHELRSLIAFARDAADHVALDTSKPVGCSATGPFSDTISGRNLIDATLAKLAAVDPQLQLGHVELTKNLPVAAGIGGGSADAAAVLRAVRRANPDRAEAIDWHGIALSLGADVPVCLVSHLSWMAGLGEHITGLDRSAFNDAFAVIANPLVSVPDDKTARVFRALRAPPFKRDARHAHPPYGYGGTNLFEITAAGQNSLQAAAIEVVPEITRVLEGVAALPGAGSARMSGAGPTCFGLFDTLEQAKRAAEHLAAAHPTWWVKATWLD